MKTSQKLLQYSDNTSAKMDMSWYQSSRDLMVYINLTEAYDTYKDKQPPFEKGEKVFKYSEKMSFGLTFSEIMKINFAIKEYYESDAGVWSVELEKKLGGKSKLDNIVLAIGVSDEYPNGFVGIREIGKEEADDREYTFDGGYIETNEVKLFQGTNPAELEEVNYTKFDEIIKVLEQAEFILNSVRLDLPEDANSAPAEGGRSRRQVNATGAVRSRGGKTGSGAVRSRTIGPKNNSAAPVQAVQAVSEEQVFDEE